MLQTQASLEALLVKAYQRTLALAAMQAMATTAALKVLATTALSHHRSHLNLFNHSVEALGGQQQTSPDPRYESLLTGQLTQLAKMSPENATSGVVELAITLESVAAETYVKNGPAFSSGRAREATASVTGIEAQHVAALRALQAIQKALPAPTLSFGADAGRALPASAGDVGFPNAFYETSLASPADEGAVR